jgi:hypothetical protein
MMVYRTNATDLHVQEMREEEAELNLVSRDTRRRRLRVGLALASLLTCGSVAPFVYAAVRPPHAETRCHYVQIQYENAPWLPTDAWHACRQVMVP